MYIKLKKFARLYINNSKKDDVVMTRAIPEKKGHLEKKNFIIRMLKIKMHIG